MRRPSASMDIPMPEKFTCEVSLIIDVGNCRRHVIGHWVRGGEPLWHCDVLIPNVLNYHWWVDVQNNSIPSLKWDRLIRLECTSIMLQLTSAINADPTQAAKVTNTEGICW